MRRSDLITFFGSIPPVLIGMEACGGAHFWARELAALGHEVRLMPPAYVTPYVKRGKTDAADAEAICEAVTRPTMRLASIKTVPQQSAGVELKVRQLLIRQRTRTVNALRGHLAEFGIVAAKGIGRLNELIAIVRDASDRRLPDAVRDVLQDLIQEIDGLNDRIRRIDRRLVKHCREDETARRLATIPAVGPITACALQAMLTAPKSFRSTRHFAPRISLTLRANSSGGEERLGPISKQGNTMLRSLLLLGAIARLRNVRSSPERDGWMSALLARRPYKVAAVAVANKLARIAWALMVRGGIYRETATS
ncbi:IS110 family transposase [Oceanicola sp. 22II-s10i]|uniref:IS110 family transposase n=1 Tax=Oceanicola sp. 22II-s10i TaxID=1317116 RepID=UPI0020CED242|nr:IS110 family transposase [Oceanicola sp. 22II-s10i]